MGRLHLPSDTERFVIGVDAGTASVRAGLFRLDGQRVATAAHPIQLWYPEPDHVEQSSNDIWRAVCAVTRRCLSDSGIEPRLVAGIGFDATCSLVVLDRNGEPLSVHPAGDAERNVIVWMDHRALREADEITEGGYDVLKFVGDRMSPEMETPKLLWLKRNHPSTWRAAGRFMDLADFLAWKASGVFAASVCTLTCKWTWLAHEHRFDPAYLAAIGIDDAFRERKVSVDVRSMGSPLGGLTPEAAHETGLSTTCVVGTGMIDAHAGGLGVLGAARQSVDSSEKPFETAMALIGGTSNCHMAVSTERRFIPGLWGPYYGAMVPDMWLTEGGQSSGGSGIDYAIDAHPNAARLRAEAENTGSTVYELLNNEVARLAAAESLAIPAFVTRDFHVLPYFIGNRSPHADPHARAVFDGISLDTSISTQAVQYYATVQAVAYGSRDIVRALNEAGYHINTLYVTGGGTRNPLWLREHADATGLNLILPRESEAVLLGSAMLGAVASGAYSTLVEAMQGMASAGEIIRPNPATAAYHDARFTIFREMYRQQLLRRESMKKFGAAVE
ncbi:MAG: FGGY-family carbohydrate kinase [Armatimonadetes bacterium]|nr:FGGY-family carbohydrate kinase [Armatimonadota bacterium]MDE2205422.1 FGGY-family carbohydrate kinase [Armatimonadota bacterium]